MLYDAVYIHLTQTYSSCGGAGCMENGIFVESEIENKIFVKFDLVFIWLFICLCNIPPYLDKAKAATRAMLLLPIPNRVCRVLVFAC